MPKARITFFTSFFIAFFFAFVARLVSAGW
jgi:hypothetical protein